MSETGTNTNAVSGARHLAIFAAAILLPALLTACGKKGQNDETKPLRKVRTSF